MLISLILSFLSLKLRNMLFSQYKNVQHCLKNNKKKKEKMFQNIIVLLASIALFCSLSNGIMIYCSLNAVLFNK